MKIGHVQQTFGITTKPTVRKHYAPGCWNDITEGSYKDYHFKTYKNYQDGKLCSTLIMLERFGKWIKSKLKYTDIDNKKKVLSCHR